MSSFGGYIRRNHLGLIAIFIALGGTTYAANKVGSSDIAKNAVRSKHIKAKQVKPGDLSRKARDGCPQGSRQLGPICVRFGAPAGTSWFTAVGVCAEHDMRIPTLGEADELARNRDIPGIAEDGKYWTDELIGDALAITGGESAGYFTYEALGDTGTATICVTEPREGG